MKIMRPLLFIVFSILLLSSLLADEEDKSHETVKSALFSFTYPISTGGAQSRLYAHHFSLAILNDYNGAVAGFSLAGLLSMNQADSYGFQTSGLLNYNMNGGFAGFQAAGLSNTLTGYVVGLQVAGLFNYARKTKGMQLSGLFNWADDANAAQITSLFNWADKSRGLQLAGLFNWSQDNTGLQLSALFNRAAHVKGAQIGLINIADEVDGVQIGLINIAGKNAYREIELTVSELWYTEFSYKMGTPWFYSTVNFGVRYKSSGTLLGFGFGIGSYIPVHEKAKGWVEFTFFSFNHPKKLFSDSSMVFRITGGFSHYFLHNRLVVKWAPTLNLTRISMGREDLTLHTYSFSDWQAQGKRLNMWPGFRFGVGFRF